MVSQELILKAFDDAIWKCSPSSKARKIGASITKSEYVNNDGVKTLVYEYSDGTRIEIETDKPVTITREDGTTYDTYLETFFSKLTYNNKEYPLSWGDSSEYFGYNPYEFFQYQKDYIIENYGEEGWDFFCEYSNEFGTYQGWNLNILLRGEKTKADITDIDGDFYISPFLLDNHDRFVEMEKSLPLDHEDCVTLRIMNELHRNDSIGKKIVSDKGHTSTSTIGEREHYDTYGDYINGWFVFTINDKGSGVHGAFLGNAIEEANGFDFESEVNYPPNQEFERLLIDEENKIIIQKPIP